MIFAEAQRMDALLLGRRTYEMFADYWPEAGPDNPFAALINGVPKYVASRTLAEPLAWNGSALVDGDLATGIPKVKDRYTEVQVIGSLDLVQSLLHLGLADTLNLWLYPVLLGSGKRVFAHGTVPVALRLTTSETYPSGVVHLTYEPAGAPTFQDLG